MRIRYLLPATLFILLTTGLWPAWSQAQSGGAITGRVTEAATGAPLPGANVVVEGTTRGASTDSDGRFRLRDVPAGTQTVVVSFVGFEPAEATLTIDAGATVEEDFALESQTLQSGEVIVTGLRRSQSRAISQKRQAFNVVDVLSADDIGSLPEQNVAEAVQRLPGMVIRNDRGEGRFVSIRGSAAALNNVTLDGNTLASTASSRATALDLLPAEMVSNIEVTKAVTPDMDGNAIGGSININTLSAFDRSGAFAFGSFRGVDHDQQVDGLRDPKRPFRANVTAGTQFGANDQFGLVVSGSGGRRDFTSSGLKGEGWDDAVDRVFNGFAVPEAIEQIVESHLRTRFALNASLDWEPTDQTSIYVRPYYTYTDEEKLDNELEYNLIGEGTPARSGARFTEGFGSVDLSKTDEQEALWGGSVGIEQELGRAITWSASGTFTRGVLDETKPDGEFETPIDERGAGVADMSNFLFDFYPENPGYISNAANYKANDIDVEYLAITEDTWSAKTDLQVPLQVGEIAGYVKTGGALTRRDKQVNGAELEFVTDFENTDVTMAQFEAPSVQTVQVGNGLFPFADTDAFVDWFFNEACAPPRDRKFSGDRSCQIDGGPYTINAEEVQTEDVERDSDNDESVYAGYAMASAELGPLTALAGARVEHTVTGSRRFQLVEDDATGTLTTTSQNFENAYTDVLPSVHLTLQATDNLQFRAAWTNTIGRPDYDDLSAFSEVDIEPVANSDLFIAGIEEGNPDLQPFRAMNVDLTAEYYLETGGLASVAGFYKRIDNPIYTFETTERNVENPFGEGRTFQRIFRQQQRNADQGTILGLEAAYQQPFTFLSAPFDGLGIVANVTVTDSEVEVPGREGSDLPFFEQADLTYNIIPYFQKQGFEARVAWNYRGSFLEDLGDIPAEDEYVSDRTTVDVDASYQFAGLFGQPEFFVQVENLTDAPEVFYDGQPEHLAFHYLSGRTVTLGLSVNL